MMVSCFLLFRLGLLNRGRDGLSFVCFLMEGFLSAYVCGGNFVKSRPVGVVKFCVMDSCREV